MPRRKSLFDIGTPDDAPLQVKTIHANKIGNWLNNTIDSAIAAIDSVFTPRAYALA